MKITTVLLDAGGVLLDESEQERWWAEAIARRLAPRMPGYDLDAYAADVAEEAFRELREEARRTPRTLRLMPGIREEVEALAQVYAAVHESAPPKCK